MDELDVLLKMKSWKIWRVIVSVLIALLLASVAFLYFWGRRDLSNFMIDDAVTARVIERFDLLGKETGNELTFGGGTSGKAKGEIGLSNVMYFGIIESGGEVLGVHYLYGRNKDVVRFSLGKQNPFETTVLSASLSENKGLSDSFDSMMERLERTDKNNHRLITEGVTYR